MGDRLKFYFDKEGDALDISVGTPKKAISKELEDDIIVRIDSKNHVVGLTILNFSKRFQNDNIQEIVPIEASFALAN